MANFTYRDATILEIEEPCATVSGNNGGRDEFGNVYFFPNTAVSIGYWFDNEGVSKDDWNTHFVVKLWVNGVYQQTSQMLADTGRVEGQRSYSFFSCKFSEPGTYNVELRGRNTKSVTVVVKEKVEDKYPPVGNPDPDPDPYPDPDPDPAEDPSSVPSSFISNPLLLVGVGVVILFLATD